MPLNKDAVLDCMPALFNHLREEEDPAVRTVLGHWLFVYIHPYMDGNGRMGRFLMNAMLACDGYPWTVIPVADRRCRIFIARYSLMAAASRSPPQEHDKSGLNIPSTAYKHYQTIHDNQISRTAPSAAGLRFECSRRVGRRRASATTLRPSPFRKTVIIQFGRALTPGVVRFHLAAGQVLANRVTGEPRSSFIPSYRHPFAEMPSSYHA